MDSSAATMFLGKMLDITQNNYGPPSTDTTNLHLSNMSLSDAQTKLLENTRTSFNGTQFTKEELELFAVNPPLISGYKNIKVLFFKVNVRGVDGEVISEMLTLNDIHSNAIILYLLTLINQMLKNNLPIQFQRLLFGGKQLEPFSTVAEYNLENASTIHVINRIRAGAPPGQTEIVYSPPIHLLDEMYHFDFTQLNDVNRIFHRGGSIYARPCGWMRFALKCNGTYSDNIWLTGSSSRSKETSSADGEWIVSYHGTCHHNGLSIASEGYKLIKGVRFAFGHGIYSTPDIEVALLYAQTFTIDGVSYKAIIQNRVNPKTVVKVSKKETGVGEYWISPKNEDIRPYGFCVRKA